MKNNYILYLFTFNFYTMRTKNLFKVFATLVALFSVLTLTNAQNYITTSGYTNLTYPTGDGSFVDTTAGAGDNYTELVTVGSVTPYLIRQDVNIARLIATGVYNPSVFYFGIGIAAAAPAASFSTVDYTVKDTLNANLSLSLLGTAAQQAAPYTLDTSFAVNWLTTGSRTIYVKESPISAIAGVDACDGIFSRLGVTVYPKPVVDWNDDQTAGGTGPWVVSACSGASTPISVDFIGYDDVRVVYDSIFTNLSGATSLAGTDSTDFAGGFGVQNSQTAQTLTTWDGDLDRTGAVLGTPRYGFVTYTIRYVNDPISRKSLKRNLATAAYGAVASAANTDVNLATGGNTLASANIPSHNYRVYFLPTPSARPIKHLTNTGW